ncbi:DUF1338 domain-containing protein [Sphingobacterium paludis]|uniref:2-oxoadipate dioxygenase/decarboxylase n=1 Tax=Sphingobacterium paludis TaxID=1476465 RepID=A0A4R7D063_9SPHI|nr:DUF1338 domain-containing protein [Sphingobacterium paludis]TDS13677.1 uncharacterized protein DUF1338 [Sphingobacterium paludis]
MHFDEQKPLDIVLNDLFDQYSKHVADVSKITNALLEKAVINSQEDIVNDHIAFRTLGVSHLGIQSFEKIFQAYGYERRDHYYFEAKKLDAYWYAPPAPHYPRIFVSELQVKALSEEAQQIIYRYTNPIVADPVAKLDLADGPGVAAFLQQPLWSLPTAKDYERLLQESEYAAWVIYNRYYLNHYTISIHELQAGYNTLEAFNAFLEGIGIKLNTSGGKIKTSADGLLRQSSTVSALYDATFSDGRTLQIAGSYVEFAERLPLPAYQHLDPRELTAAHRREGFEANNADKIFESTYTQQIHKG